MHLCNLYDIDEIGSRYASLTDLSLLTAGDEHLSTEQRTLRDALLAFEKHYFECGDCLARLRAEREIQAGFKRLDKDRKGSSLLLELASVEGPVRTGALPRHWLPVAASLLLAANVTLGLWAIWLQRTVRSSAMARGPEVVSSMVQLQPASLQVRSAQGDISTVDIGDGPSLLAVRIPERVAAAGIIGVGIEDSEGHALWKTDKQVVDGSGMLTVLIPRAGLEAGRYALVVRFNDPGPGARLRERSAAFPFVIKSGENNKVE